MKQSHISNVLLITLQIQEVADAVFHRGRHSLGGGNHLLDLFFFKKLHKNEDIFAERGERPSLPNISADGRLYLKDGRLHGCAKIQ